jgi:hypothetical protein
VEPNRPVTVLLACGALAVAGCRGGSDAGGISPDGAQQSCNWAGYVKTGPAQSFTGASGTWIVPAVSCGSEDSASSSWIGVGGGTTQDPTLVQAGTEQDCFNGVPSYDAWWELIPAPSTSASGPIDTGQFPVGPGDQISASVDGSNAVVWNIRIHNDTRGWTFQTTVGYTSAGGTAEWIEEAPFTGDTGGPCPGQSPLANFGRATFFNARANGAPPGLDLSERVVMVDIAGNVKANTSAPDRGDAFDVCFGSGNC